MDEKKSKILIVEDEESIARFVELELVYEGYRVTKAYDGKKGLEVFCSQSFDLILLDIMLPGLSGLEVLKRIRQTSDVPVIMLTARDSVADKVSGLDLGSNDYITKPFATEELLARIRAALRIRETAKGDTHDLLSSGAVELDLLGHTVRVKGTLVELTHREFELLAYLLQNKGIVLSRDTLLAKVWGYEYQGETNVVDVYIRYLRSKVDEPFQLHTISTVRGVGYVIREEKE